jgi:ABC-type antimicrobial peptide transport system ATPase subunit
MTQTNSPETRIERLEAITLELATANMRHSSRMDRIEETIDRVGHKLDQVADQQEAMRVQQEINMQAIASLTASLVELRNIVADDIARRSS